MCDIIDAWCDHEVQFNSLTFKNVCNLARRKFMELPENDTEMSKHVGVNIIQRDSVVIYVYLCISWLELKKKDALYMHENN